MKYAKNQLLKYRQSPLIIEETSNLEEQAKSRFSETVLALSPLEVTGSINYLDNDDITLDVNVLGNITVPSSRSLDPVVVPINLAFSELYIEDESRLKDFEETEAVFVLENDSLNVDDAILDNIIATLPLQILTPEEETGDNLPSGKDWHVISQEAYENEKMIEDEPKIDPRLSKLDDFFKE
ncbi:YceD family protein [Leuconostoc mesenteroides]|uniref:YceD family protein n=1 Tax=Leuconostoc mesenteroides TaxID=1245 RepID=UPI002362B6C5|nr:YceD family protein [Leuconostoc mesenteroides]